MRRRHLCYALVFLLPALVAVSGPPGTPGTTVVAQDVTARRAQLAERMRAVVESHPEVRRCQDIELSYRHHRIHAPVVAEVAGELSLEDAHRIESELEEMIRRAAPEVHEVVATVTE